MAAELFLRRQANCGDKLAYINPRDDPKPLTKRKVHARADKQKEQDFCVYKWLNPTVKLLIGYLSSKHSWLCRYLMIEGGLPIGVFVVCQSLIN